MTYPGQFYPSSWVEVALWRNWMPTSDQDLREDVVTVGKTATNTNEGESK